MKSSTILLALAGCAPVFDLDEPIQIEPIGVWNVQQRMDLEAAAACWKLRFGIPFEVTSSPGASQRVKIVFDEFRCLDTQLGQTSQGFEAEISLCPSRLTQGQAGRLRLFWVIAHELGHAAGIHAEGSDDRSIMGSSWPSIGWLLAGSESGSMFSEEDAALLAHAQPDFELAPTCDPVVRHDPQQPGDVWQRQYCACP